MRDEATDMVDELAVQLVDEPTNMILREMEETQEGSAMITEAIIIIMEDHRAEEDKAPCRDAAEAAEDNVMLRIITCV